MDKSNIYVIKILEGIIGNQQSNLSAQAIRRLKPTAMDKALIMAASSSKLYPLPFTSVNGFINA